jgi:hypothetical protein
MPVAHTQGTGDSYCFFACTHGRAACLHARMEWWREAVSGSCCIDTIPPFLLKKRRKYYYAWYYDRGLRATYSTCMTGGTRTHMHACMPRFKWGPAWTDMHAPCMRKSLPSVVRACPCPLPAPLILCSDMDAIQLQPAIPCFSSWSIHPSVIPFRSLFYVRYFIGSALQNA